MSTFKTIIAFLLTYYNTRPTLASDGRIFGGHDCNITDKPFYVYLKILLNGHKVRKVFCGGSLITTTTILTAGHCCFEAKEAIMFTGYDRAKEDFDQSMPIRKTFILHPKYDHVLESNDFCLVKLRSPVKITKRTQLIALASKKLMKELMENQKERKNYRLDVMGYGRNTKDKSGEFTVNFSKPFQCTTTVLKTQKRCLEFMADEERETYDKKSMFCHYNPVNTTRGTCQGDSGSPVVYNGKLIGLVSWGVNSEVCTEKIEIAARLDAALDWINSNI